METRLKEAQSQLATRQRRVAELEQAMEGANAVRTRAEKELQAKITAAEQKANDAAAKLQAAIAEKKTIEARTRSRSRTPTASTRPRSSAASR
jgi:ParB family chromosome partitioning protein